MQLTKLFNDFTNNERAGGIVLIACTLISLVAANLFIGYHDFWYLQLGSHTVTHWINDGLMTIFFLLIGLELEREVYCGELSTVRSAALPGIAALGGMAVPALIYYICNLRGGDVAGIGVPMATDIAFALAVLSLAGPRVPVSLKIFLTALAVMDDLGAILIIAIFYSDGIVWLNLGIALGIWVILFVFNRLKIHLAWPYLIGGAAMWYFMMGSGVHATITGVIVAFAIPFGSGDEKTISHRLQHFLHKPVAFIILPLFALANTSIVLSDGFYRDLGSAVSIGVMIGLFIGKPLGIFTFTYASVKLKLTDLASDINWKHIFGVGMLAGIGFTMSIFISLLAFNNDSVIDHAKIAVLLASFVSGIVGLLYLRSITRPHEKKVLEFKIRVANTNEFRQIGELMVRAYSQLEGFPKEKDFPEYYNLLRNLGTLTSKPDASLLVAVTSSNEISGAVLYFGDIAQYGSGGTATREENTAGFRLLAVDPVMQGKGVGKILTQSCIEQARQQRKRQLILHTTHAMQTAWKMYEKIGFSRYEELDFTEGDLAVLGFKMKLTQELSNSGPE